MTHAHTPVLVGCAAIQQRTSDLAASREAIALMIDAVRSAADDCGNHSILTHVDRICVPQGMWGYSDPARLIAAAIGSDTATSVLAEIGILQQTLIGDACARIARGEIRCAIIAGGEAKYRQLQASIQQTTATETVQTAAPDEVMQPEAELWLDAETCAGLMMPVGFYAIMESAWRHAHGESLEQNRDRIAARYQHFSEIAAANPHAWKRDLQSAQQIRAANGKNRMLAFPYSKAHNSEWNVDQASALILCSEALADELDIAQQKRIYPVASSESNHMLCVSQREQLHRAPGAALAAQAALQHAQLDIADIALLDLYSCFPCAVQFHADALGVTDNKRALTVTGGMAAAGGPLNNYVLQASCRMAECLREQSRLSGHACNGLVSSVSGMLTKHAFGLWSSTRPARDFAWLDVTDVVRDDNPARTVLDEYCGAAVIVGYTVLHQGDAPARAIIIADTADNKRAVAFSEDSTLMQQMMQDEWCGRSIAINGKVFAVI